jgi:hypothetical protein
MTTQYTPSLRLALPGTGELDGLWGQVVNDQITELVEQALTGHVAITTWTTNQHTLVSTDGAVDQARAAVIDAQTGNGNAGAAFTLFAPAQPKLYVIKNSTGNVLNFKSVAVGASTVSIPNGHTVYVSCDGTNSALNVNYVQGLRAAGLGLVDGATAQSFVSLAPGSSHTLNADVANFYYLPNTGGGTVTITLNPTSTTALSNNVSFLALLINPGTGSIVWNAPVKWPNNLAPVINSDTLNLFLFTKYSASTSWYGAVLNNYTTL